MTSSSSRRALSVVTALALVVSAFAFARPAMGAVGDTYTIGDASIEEGNSGTRSLIFTATRSNELDTYPLASTHAVTVTPAGTHPATEGVDFTAPANVTFAAGASTTTYVVTVIGDTTAEHDETFDVAINATVECATGNSDCTGRGTILTDDPQITVDNVTNVEEGGVATFTVSVTPPSPNEVTVDYTTKSGTAVAGQDFDAKAGTLVFEPHQASTQVEITTTDDEINELTEAFTLELSNPNAEATIQDGVGEGSISDNDAVPTLSVDDPQKAENATPLTFTVTLSAASGREVTVAYATEDGTAEAGSDYTARSGTLTFAAGITEQTVEVTLINDENDEVNEDLDLVLSSPSASATIDKATGTGTILDDDNAPEMSIGDQTVVEPDAGTTNAVFTVTLTPASGQTVVVDYETANDTATAGEDYIQTANTLTFAPGETTKTITVPVNGDTKFETDEQFFVDLSADGDEPVTIQDSRGVGTITNDDTAPTISVANATAAEGAPVNFAVSLSNPTYQTITVDYITADGSAESPDDYAAEAGTVTFLPDDTTEQIAVTTVDDAVDEANETFTVTLSNVAGTATISRATATGTITDNDEGPEISIANSSVTEGHTGTVAMTFTVSLSEASGQNVTVDYATSNGSATAGNDYVARTGTATIFAGQLSTTFNVTVNGDTLPETNETFWVTLSNPTNATIAEGEGVATGTITNDDAGSASMLSINNQTVTEGDTDKTVTFTVSLSPASTETVTVKYATVDGTAKAGSDYTAATGTLTFSPSDTSETVTITVLGDDVYEGTEAYTVVLSEPTNAGIADGAGDGTITDDETLPSVSVSDGEAIEGDTGVTKMAFTVTLSGAAQSPVTVGYATSDGTAKTPQDYTAKTDTLEFAPGETEKTIEVDIVGDRRHEGDETFTITLSNPTNASLGDAAGSGLIRDDESEPKIVVSDASADETDDGTSDLVFTVSLTVPSDRTVTVDFATADGTATGDDDYEPTSGTLTFDPGEIAQTITVTVYGDVIDEADETVVVNLSNADSGTIEDGQGIGTIRDNDDEPTFSVADESIGEGDEGTSDLTFTVALSGPSSSELTVDVTTDAGTASEPGDYTSEPVTLTFAPGDTEKTYTVSVNGDAVFEEDEQFDVVLSDASAGASIADDRATGTIVNDDSAPTLAIDDVIEIEGDEGTTEFTFTVTKAGATEQPVTVDFATADGTAVAPGDYAADDGTLTFAADETEKTVTVVVNGDTVSEADETFSVTLDNVDGATISEGTGTGTITDDDDEPALSIGDATVTEGNSGTNNAAFTVTLEPASGQTVTVDFATSNGTATAGSDYTATNGTLTFVAGDTTETINVPVAGDTVDEPNETFIVTLSNASNATITDDTGTGTITDNDGPVSLAIDDVTATEGDSGTTNATFTVTKTGATSFTSTVAYATSNGTATAPADYTATSGTLTFAAGETSKTLTVAVRGDVVDEANETFNVTLSNATNATISDATGVGTITDDDEPAQPQTQQRYVLVGGDGKVYAFNTTHRGDMAGQKLNQPIIGLTMTPTGNGYWLVAKDGGIFTFGDAQFFGSMGDQKLNQPVLGMEATPTGKGYWLFAADGGIFTFGDAKFHGSTGNMTLNAPMIGMETTGDGSGYWLVAQDGGIFTFNAPFHGSTGDTKLNQPVFDMAALDDGSGYWLVARDGGIFTFGTAGFEGSAVGQTTSTVIGMRDTPSGEGYWIADATGKVMVFGDADYLGDVRTTVMTPPIVGFAAVES